MNSPQKLLVLLMTTVFFTGCSDSELPPNEKVQAPKVETQVQASTIPSHPVKGVIRGSEFQIEQAKLDNGTLTLRQGKEFFADKSVSIFIFEKGSFDNKTIKIDSKTGFGKPHIHLAIKPKDANLPNTKIIMDGYEMELSFGETEELGIPFAISLLVNGDNKTDIKGHSFATFKDLRVQGGQIDVSYDSFDTLGYLARQSMQNKYQDIQWHKSFGATYSGSSDSSYPKTGFIGYEVSIEGAPVSVVKAQLYKDAEGWRVINQLAENQIHQAHPIAEYVIENKRSLHSRAAKTAAALALEEELNQQGLMPKVRTTSASCYLTKDYSKASCQVIYGVRQADETVCMSKNYLLLKSNDSWHVEKEIAATEKVDYNSGVLTTYKPFSLNCG